MKQKWKPTQYVEISVYEIFAFQDKLDAIKDDPEKVWEVVDDFFWECECQLELSPHFIKELQEIDLDKDFVPINNIEELLKEDDDYEANYATAQDYVNYVLAQTPTTEEVMGCDGACKNKYDIPFVPRHQF